MTTEITELRMVGLDLSPTGTGIAVTHDHHGRPGLACRTALSPWGPDRPHDRLQSILNDVAAAAKCRPHLVLIEGASYGSSGNVVDQLAGLRWVVKHWLWVQMIPYIEITPATLKVWATGSGATHGENKVTKDKVIAGVVAVYGHLVHIDPRDDNQADAVALVTMGRAAYGQPMATVNVHRRRALETPSWRTLSTESGPVVPA